jgi:aldehyde dehydrogenase (NAD+)
MLLAPSHTEVRREPFGVVLVMSPFNYPMNLGLVPLVGAIAAGNVVVLKPSEQTIAVEQWYLKRFGAAVSRDVIRVVSGDIPRTTALLAQPWNFIFFTGSPMVGKIVSHAAAEHLTPTVMELGGKAPVYVDASCGSLNEAAKRIAFGKFINSGQTCMAPDYVLVHHSIHKQLVDLLVK